MQAVGDLNAEVRFTKLALLSAAGYDDFADNGGIGHTRDDVGIACNDQMRGLIAETNGGTAARGEVVAANVQLASGDGRGGFHPGDGRSGRRLIRGLLFACHS